MEKFMIKNRKGQNVAVVVEKPDNSRGLAFVMHGLGGFKEQDHIQAVAQAFFSKGFIVSRFDTTNSIGESEGDYEKATLTNYYEDLEDVIDWSRGQEWHLEPFVLTGHSLGGICSALYAEKHPARVLGLMPISTVVSGKLSFEAHQKSNPEDFAKWEETGWQERPSVSRPGMVKRLPWSHTVDRLKYDLLPEAKRLTMPVILIVGELDDGTPVEHNKILFDALPGPKEMHIIKNGPHTFRDPNQLKEIQLLIEKWVDTLPK